MSWSKTASLALAGLALIWGSAAEADEKIPVVATFSILGDFVAKVGGDRVAVRTIVGPEGDAHVYEPTPADAADIAKAKVVFENGLGFEGWMERLTKSSGFKGPIVVATKGIGALKTDQENYDEEGKTDSHDTKTRGHDHGELDPHAWQSVKNAIVYVANVKDGLCMADTPGCPSYTKNAEIYTAELEKLHNEIKARFILMPAKARKVITSHDAFGYFADAYGIEFMAPTGISTESEASAKDVARLIDQIKQQRVKALFVENITDTRLIKQIGNDAGVKLGGTLYSDALSNDGGPAGTYLDMMRHNVRLLAGAMVGA